MNTGFNDWNQAAGILKSIKPFVNLETLNSVLVSAKAASTVAPCS